MGFSHRCTLTLIYTNICANQSSLTLKPLACTRQDCTTVSLFDETPSSSLRSQQGIDTCSLTIHTTPPVSQQLVAGAWYLLWFVSFLFQFLFFTWFLLFIKVTGIVGLRVVTIVLLNLRLLLEPALMFPFHPYILTIPKYINLATPCIHSSC